MWACRLILTTHRKMESGVCLVYSFRSQYVRVFQWHRTSLIKWWDDCFPLGGSEPDTKLRSRIPKQYPIKAFPPTLTWGISSQVGGSVRNARSAADCTYPDFVSSYMRILLCSHRVHPTLLHKWLVHNNIGLSFPSHTHPSLLNILHGQLQNQVLSIATYLE